MKYLITGGAGFIGSHLAERLLEEGHDVVCLDNLLTGSKAHLRHLSRYSDRFTFIEADANRLADLERVFAKHEFDGIFHYAAVCGVKRTLEDPIAVLDDVSSIRNVAELAACHGKPKIVYASSSEVYGEPVEIPEREGGHVNPSYPYSVAKLYGEKLFQAYFEKRGVPAVSLRIFNAYGPRQISNSYGAVTGVFIRNVLQGQSPMIYGDGTQTRDFVYIDDNVEATLLAMESTKADGHAINLGTGKPTTILDLAEDIIDLCDMRGKVGVAFAPPREDVKHRFPDVHKMRTLLDFRPKVSLHEGLKRTIQWHREHLSG